MNLHITNVKDKGNDWIATIEHKGQSVEILVPKDEWFWKEYNTEPYGFNLVTYGHYQ